VGESTVGKTAICHQLSSDGTDFPKNYITTSLCDVLVKAVKIPDTNDLGAVHLLLSRFYPDFIQILSRFYLDFILILSYFILILS
jgi:hypothetical protein